MQKVQREKVYSLVKGDLPFEQIIPILNNHPDRSFAIEVWKGHERQGEGFRYFLDKMVEGGLLVQ